MRTKKAAMGVRGTQFFVGYTKADVFMCVNKGSVWVVGAKEKKQVTVKEGEGVRVGSKVSDPTFLPWTKNLNWKLDSAFGNLENDAKIEETYKDALSQDYD